MSDHSDLEQRVTRLEATINDLEHCNRGNVTAVLRITAQASAAYSLLAEVTEQHGLPLEAISAHYQLRSAYYLDRLLADAEKENPQLGAALDDREPEEIPGFDGFPPLFSDEDSDGDVED